jgi:hypothetical protein
MNSRITRTLRVLAVTLVLAAPAVAPQVASAGWTWDESAPTSESAVASPELPAQASP